MITYSVKKNKRTRLTFRIFGIFLVLFGGTQITLFALGYAKNHIIGTILCLLLAIYGIYMIIHSFKKQSYDIKYEFGEDDFSVIHYRGKTTYRYEDISLLDIIVPENELIYCLLHIVIENKDSKKNKKEDFVIPFSYKKEVCDQIYKHVNERMTTKSLENEKS